MGNGIFDTLATQQQSPPPPSGNGVFDQIHAEKQETESAPRRLARGVLSTLGLPESIADIPGWADKMMENRNDNPQAYQASEAAKIATGGASRILENIFGGMGVAQLQTFQKPGWQNKVAGMVPLIGPTASKASDEVNKGNYAGAVGTELALPIAAAAGSPNVREAIAANSPDVGAAASQGREAVGNAIHTPEGDLKPGVQIASKVAGGAAGAALGSTVGHEYLGAAAGYKLGPSLLDKMFPEAQSAVDARAQYEQAKTLTEAQEAAIAKNKTIDTVTARDALRTQKAAEQAAQDALDARDKTAQDLMNRQSQQDKLDAAEAKAANAAARARRQAEQDHANNLADIERARQTDLASAEKLRNQYAQDLMNRQKQQDALDKAAKQASDDAQDARDQHAEDLMTRQKQQDTLDRKAVLAAREAWNNRPNKGTVPQAQEASTSPAAPEGGTPSLGGQDLISRMRKIVLPGEEPSAEDLKRAGDFTQVPLPKLQLLAKMGDRLAQNEINRRLRNQ